MADPATMVGAAGIGTSLLSSLLGAGGAAVSGQAQQNQFLYKAGLAQINQQIATQNANYAAYAGEESAAKYGIGAREQAGKIIAAQSSSNTDVRSGSNREVQESQQTVSSIDLAQIRQNAAKTAWDYQAQAKQFGAEATMDTAAAKDTGRATGINIAQSFISGGASVASKWLQGNQQSLWGGSSNNQQALGA